MRKLGQGDPLGRWFAVREQIGYPPKAMCSRVARYCAVVFVDAGSAT
jgi:hypothetical protein